MTLSFARLPLEMQATIFSYFTAAEAFHVLRWVCKEWRTICSVTNFQQQFFVTAQNVLFCLGLDGKEEYMIKWGHDDVEDWFTGNCFSPDYKLLVADYKTNGILQLTFNLDTWRFEYDSVFYIHPEEEWRPEKLIVFERNLYIAADSTDTLSVINENRKCTVIYNSDEPELGFWGMAAKETENGLDLFCCLPTEVVQVSVPQNGENIKVKTFIQIPKKFKVSRLGCLAFAPPGMVEPFCGCSLVLDSFVGRLYLFSPNGNFISLMGEGKHLERCFDIAFVDRELYPFHGTTATQKRSQSISTLVFSPHGILEYSPQGILLRKISETSLNDCNFVFTTPCIMCS